jgi:hypothetical protein
MSRALRHPDGALAVYVGPCSANGFRASIGRDAGTFRGMQIIEDVGMVEEDWSGVRSPSRAERRRRQGHRQNIRFVPKKEAYVVDRGRALVMHPAMALELRKQCQELKPTWL